MENRILSFYGEEVRGPDFCFESSDLYDRISELCLSIGFCEAEKPVGDYSINVDFVSASKLRRFAFAYPEARMGFGNEMIFTRVTHKIYVLQNVAVLIFSEKSKNWNLYINNSDFFWKSLEHITLLKTLFARVLSFACEHLKLFGFFGVLMSNKLIVMSAKESKGNFVFLDMENKKALSSRGRQELENPVTIVKLEDTLHETEKKIGREDLLILLTTKSTYLSSLIMSKKYKEAFKELPTKLKGKTLSRRKFSAIFRTQEITEILF